jgi:hypothetical protein
MAAAFGLDGQGEPLKNWLPVCGKAVDERNFRSRVNREQSENLTVSTFEIT